MPTNVTAEYNVAELEYQNANTPSEKIKALERMYAEVPKHKGTEKLRQEIKTKIAKHKRAIEKEKERKTKGFSIAIKKESAAQIVLTGPANSGKSTILRKLTNRNVEIADYPFTTKMPEVGIMKYKELKLQVVEIPAIVEDSSYKGKGPQFFSIIRNSDFVVIVTDTSKLDYFFDEFEKSNIKLNEDFREEDEEIKYLNALIVLNKTDLEKTKKAYQGLCNYYNFKTIQISAYNDKDIEKLKDEIWKGLGKIKIYTKEPGKKARKDEPVCLNKKDKIRDMAEHIHKDFIHRFRFARVWGRSARFSGQQVGLDHKLKDEDVVELHIR